jgi:hypothetical protein
MTMPWLIPSIACLLVALDCVRKALGVDPQTIFSVDFIWLWWFPAAQFALVGVVVFFKGARG